MDGAIAVGDVNVLVLLVLLEDGCQVLQVLGKKNESKKKIKTKRLVTMTITDSLSKREACHQTNSCIHITCLPLTSNHNTNQSQAKFLCEVFDN